MALLILPYVHRIKFKFVDTMQDEWRLGQLVPIGYLDAIAELVDFKKVNDVAELVWRCRCKAEMY